MAAIVLQLGRKYLFPAARIAVCAPETTEELEQGLHILKDLLDSLS